MSDASESKGGGAAGNFDPSSMFLSSLYGMNAVPHPLASALAGLPSGTAGSSSNNSNSTTATTLGVAASQAASLGANAAWYAMAQQLAAQDYMARLSALQQQRAEESKQQQQAAKAPRGRKKTISLDPGVAANMFLSALSAASPSAAVPPSLPSGLTIERKRGGKGRSPGSAGASMSGASGRPLVDRVEITKVPMSNGGATKDDAPLNLSLKTAPTPPPSIKSPSNKIPTDYYASQALSGAFLAEQIRQSQLAAALESRLEASHQGPSVANLQNIQAALLMNKLKASNNSSSATTASTSGRRKKASSNSGGGLGGGGTGLTVASLLSKHRNGGSSSSTTTTTVSQEEVDRAEKTVSANPELTIEPIFKSSEPSSSWGRSKSSADLLQSKEEEEERKLKIKNVSESPEIRNLSDQDSEDESETSSRQGGTSPLRLPLAQGWRREGLVREYSKSGFRGDIFYYAPCGKKFKQYSEILRYLEKRGLKDLQREHFSFSTKVLVGEFLKPTGQAENGEEKYLRLNEREMAEDLEAVRKENGWTKKRKSAAANGKEDKQQQQILLETLQQNQSSDALLHRDAMKLLKEAERAEKELKKSREEAATRQMEANVKMQQREIKRQQALLLKEQERERRRQHMIFIKLLEGKRRSDERERRREDLRVEKEKDRERRIEQRRLEYEIITELKKPCEDMSLLDEAKPIPEFERIKDMVLPGEAFANVLMIHEFIHNFGDTLGFDVEALPSLSSLQSAMLNDPEYEEELLSVVIHLVVCAIEDPGIPTPNKHLTLMGQNLRQADITNTNISEILKIYLFARAQAEVKACHGFIPPPEFFHQNNSGPVHHLSHYHYYKDKKLREEGPNLEEFTNHLFSTKPYKMSDWVKDKPFLCLNPTEKSEIIAFLCNELLGNKAVMAQVDNNLDNILVAKKRRWATENKLKKLRMLQQRKFKPQPYSPLPGPSNESSGGGVDPEAAISSDKEEDETGSVQSESKDSSSAAPSSPAAPPKRKGRPPGSRKRKWGNGKAAVGAQAKKRRSKDANDEEAPKEGEPQTESLDKGSDEDGEDEFDDDIGEEEEKMGQEELQKKVDKTLKLLNKRRDELIQSNNRFRGADLGQDRYRRRYWHLAFADGIFVEGMESSEPWKLATEGMPTEEKQLKEAQKEEEEPLTSSDEDEGAMEEEIKPEVKTEEEVKEEVKPPLKQEEEVLEERSLLKITPNGDKLNLFNHSAQFNMSLSPVILNGSVTITPKQQPCASSNASSSPKEGPWFSILPMGHPMQDNPSIPSSSEQPPSVHPFLPPQYTASPHIEMLENKLASIRRSDEEKERLPIPQELSYGWWRITSSELLRNVEYSLHPRGSREHGLLGNLKKTVEALVHHNYDGSKNPAVIGEELEFELSEVLLKAATPDENLHRGAPVADEPGKWSREVALRVEKYILEQVEALEDKVAAASMQVPGWKLPNREDIEERQFRPSCVAPDEGGETTVLPDAISEAKERLLDLEMNIERRYLKAPLGFGNNEPTLQTITSARTTMNSSKTPIEEQQENGKHVEEEENGHESGGEESTSKAASTAAAPPEVPPEKEEVLPRGLQTWREGVSRAKNAAQLAMGFYVLETSIAWHKSIMKAFCQLCHSGDNEDSLLLCDGCDKGYHMYCFKPSLVNVPDGDWYCFECINKATGIKHCLVCGKQEGRNLIHCSMCPRAYHTDCLSPALSKSPRGKWQCPACQSRAPSSSRKRYTKKAAAKHNESSPAITDNEDSVLSESPAGVPPGDSGGGDESRVAEDKGPPSKKKKGGKGVDRDLSACSTLLSELENSEEAWPFLYPVNTKQFPTYRKVIKNPMDIATIKRRLESGVYRLREDFCSDVRQIFANCEIFNEDDSPVGKAGHAMRTFFENRWTELTSA